MSLPRVRGRAPRLHRELDKYIVNGESVILAVRRHWFSLIHEMAWAATAFIVAISVDVAAPGTPGGRGLANVMWTVLLGTLGWLVWRYLNWRNEYFVATDKRFLLFYGFIRRKVAMMPLIKVTDLTFDRPLLGRLLGYGHFILESAGHDQALSEIGMIPDADHNYRLICDQLFGAGAGADPEDKDWTEGDDDDPDGGGGPGRGGGDGGVLGSEWDAAAYAARHRGSAGARWEGGSVGGSVGTSAAGSGGPSGAQSWYRSDTRVRTSDVPDTSEIPVWQESPVTRPRSRTRPRPEDEPPLFVPKEWS